MSIEVNLLPWREQYRQRQRRRWRAMLLCALLSGLLAAYGVERYYAFQLAAQRQRQALIQHYRVALQTDVQDVAGHQEQVDHWQKHQHVLREHLDRRADVLRVFNALADVAVEGVTYSAFEQRGGMWVMSGLATSHQRIAAQLQALEASSVFEAASLSVVEPLPQGWRFRLRVVHVRRAGHSS